MHLLSPLFSRVDVIIAEGPISPRMSHQLTAPLFSLAGFIRLDKRRFAFIPQSRKTNSNRHAQSLEQPEKRPPSKLPGDRRKAKNLAYGEAVLSKRNHSSSGGGGFRCGAADGGPGLLPLPLNGPGCLDPLSSRSFCSSVRMGSRSFLRESLRVSIWPSNRE